MILLRSLFFAAATLLVTGMALRVAPTPLPRGQATSLAVPAEVDSNGTPPSTASAPAYDAIVATNIFSQDRKPPSLRFSLPGREAAPTPTHSREPSLRLYGITVGEQGAVALIDADPNVAGAEMYRVGDRVGNARVLAITDSTVTLAQPSGQLVLRLRSVERPRRP